MSEREEAIRDAVSELGGYGVVYTGPEPNNSTEREALYLRARDCFEAGQQCRGWDLFEEVEANS